MIWQVVVIATGIISAVAQAIGKRQVSRMSAFQSGLVRDVATWGLVIVLYLLDGEIKIGWASLIFIVLGIFESVAMAAYYSAQREQMAATAVFSYPFSQLLIILSSSIFFGEWQYFNIMTTQGIINALAVIGLVILMSKFQITKKVKINGWSAKLMLSSLIIVGSNILAKWGVGTIGYSPTEYMFFEYLGIVIGGIVFVYGRGLSLKMEKSDWAWGIVQGLLFGVGALWYVGIIAEYPLSLASVIRRSVIVLMTVVLGVWGFGESQTLTRRQKWMMGLGVVLFGSVVLVNR